MPKRADWPVPSERPTLVGVGGIPPERRRWLDDHLALGLGLLLLLLVLVAGAAAGIYFARHGRHHRSAATVPVRTVVVTKPTTTLAARTVTTPAPIATPDFVGQPLTQASATVHGLHLRLATTPVTGSGKPAGTVVDQAPKAGKKIAHNGLVTLSVAKGAAHTATTTATTTAAPPTPKTATVPDVSGRDEQAAVQAFTQANVLPSLVFVSSSDPEGMVEAQAKPGGTTVPYLSHVQINISSGTSPTMEHVPNVVGLTLQQAVARVNAAHLKLIYVKLAGPRDQAGKIAQQTPLPGNGAPENAQVLVVLGVYR